MDKRHAEKRSNMEAIEAIKKTVREKGEIDDKEFDKIMKSKGSKEGLDPEKGQKTKARDGNTLDKAKAIQYPKARKGEQGRVGAGRFNRSFAQEKAKLTGTEDPSMSVKRKGGNFKKSKPQRPMKNGGKRFKPKGRR